MDAMPLTSLSLHLTREAGRSTPRPSSPSSGAQRQSGEEGAGLRGGGGARRGRTLLGGAGRKREARRRFELQMAFYRIQKGSFDLVPNLAQPVE
jgi:hypothetical protein